MDNRDNRELLRASIRNKKIVLVSDSMYRQFVCESNLRHWKRVVVDEADDIYCPSMPDIRAKFTWFITATPARLQRPKNFGLTYEMHVLIYSSTNQCLRSGL